MILDRLLRPEMPAAPPKRQNKTQINVRLTPEMMAAVEHYRQREHFSTFSAAMERLIWAGAKAEKVVE